MKVVLSLIMLLMVILVVDYLAESWAEDVPTRMTTLLHVGLLMLGAWLTGILFDRIQLPRISGYLVYGILVGPFVLGLIAEGRELNELDFISQLAIALIALTAGSEIKFNWLGRQLGAVSLITVIELVGVWAVVGVATFIAEDYVPLIQDAPLEQRIVMAMLTGLVAAANSPAVVIAMVNEFHAHGPVARTTLAVTIFKDMLMVILFATALAVGRGVTSADVTISPVFLVAVAIQLVGSLVIGGGLGVVMALYVHRIRSHLVFFLIGCCMGFAVLGQQSFHFAGQTVHLEPLLMGLAAGVVMQNLWPRESEPLFRTVEEMSLPIYCLFFALAGAKLDLGVLMTGWAVAVVGALFVVRVLAVAGTVTLAARLTGFAPETRNRLWLGFVPQAGIALALAALIQNAFPEEANVQVENVLIGLIALNELIGPVGFRYALVRSGEANVQS
jgi:Kef-type K+ transport system membrane component KefB